MSAPTASPRATRGLVLLLAVACGTAVANLYYAQPLLNAIGRDLGVSDGAAGLLVTAAQAGYVCGLAFVVPLGDLLPRRRLVGVLAALTIVGLGAAAAAPGLGVLAAATVLIGVTSVLAQVLVPFAADVAADEERGRVVGTVMSGLLVGILLARTVAGVVGGVASWRAMYALAAGAMAALGAVLWRRLPSVAPRAELGYGALLRSIWALAREEPVLRRRCLYGAAGFATFSALWTNLAFLLARPPFSYGTVAIGLFGIAGLVGALAASFAGRLHDAGWSHRATGAFAACSLAAWGPLAAGRRSAALIAAGAIVLDLGVQGVHILNQSRIYALRPDARSRLTTAYMTTYFTGGVVGSAVSAACWSAGGWLGVCAAGAGFALLALLVWVAEAAGLGA